jgi:hypothetical protein
MLCFEVYCNGKKLCTAGIGDYGVMTAILTWVSHSPEKLKKWAEAGITDAEAIKLDFTVGGLGRCVGEAAEHFKWVESDLVVGDEIRIRIVDAPSADPPSRRYQDDPDFVEEQRKEYVRKTANELGWGINTPSEDGGGAKFRLRPYTFASIGRRFMITNPEIVVPRLFAACICLILVGLGGAVGCKGSLLGIPIVSGLSGAFYGALAGLAFSLWLSVPFLAVWLTRSGLKRGVVVLLWGASGYASLFWYFNGDIGHTLNMILVMSLLSLLFGVIVIVMRRIVGSLR